MPRSPGRRSTAPFSMTLSMVNRARRKHAAGPPARDAEGFAGHIAEAGGDAPDRVADDGADFSAAEARSRFDGV